jgi:hypothetical protein
MIMTYAWGISLLYATPLADRALDQSQAGEAGTRRACESLRAVHLEQSYYQLMSSSICRRYLHSEDAQSGTELKGFIELSDDIHMAHLPYSRHSICRLGI